MTVNVLGTEYTLALGRDGLREDADGICDDSVKLIHVDDYQDRGSDPADKKDLDAQMRKNIRHEIVHAFLYESGLGEDSDWATNEEIVDWIARQGPKIYKAWQEVNAI